MPFIRNNRIVMASSLNASGGGGGDVDGVVFSCKLCCGDLPLFPCDEGSDAH